MSQQKTDALEVAMPATDLDFTAEMPGAAALPASKAQPLDPGPAHWVEELGFDVYMRRRFDPVSRTLVLVDSHGLSPEMTTRMERVSMDNASNQDVAPEAWLDTPEQAKLIESARNPDGAELKALQALGVQALYCLPTLNEDGEFTGTVLFGTRGADAFTQQQRRWLQAVTAQFAGLTAATRDTSDTGDHLERAPTSATMPPGIADTLQQQADRRAEELANYHSQLRHLLSELVLTEQRERRRIAGELHDHLAQLLVACKMKLALVGKAQKPADLLEEIDGFLNESLTYTRNLVAQISPVLLYEQGLLPALRWLAEAVMPRHGLTVALEEETDLADVQLAEDVRILLFQSVRELLFNVVKHADAREACVTIRREDGGLVVVVEDKGIGFDVEKVPMTGGTCQQGFGLLSIRERMTLLGGRLELTSTPGAGTRACVRLSLDPTSVPDARPAEPAPAPALPSDAEHGRRSHDHLHVLVVDDHAVVREGLMMMLAKEKGLTVVGEAADGAAALDLARRLRPHVVLMDVGLPGMDGIETTRRLVTSCRGVRVVGLSMHEDESTAAAMRAAGAVDYLCKGCSPDLLIDAVRRAAGQRSTA